MLNDNNLNINEEYTTKTYIQIKFIIKIIRILVRYSFFSLEYSGVVLNTFLDPNTIFNE